MRHPRDGDALRFDRVLLDDVDDVGVCSKNSSGSPVREPVEDVSTTEDNDLLSIAPLVSRLGHTRYLTVRRYVLLALSYKRLLVVQERSGTGAHRVLQL